MKRRILVPLLALAVLAAACGDDDASAPPEPAASAAAAPARIVSLSPTATEVLFAIGAGDLVVAVDDQSNFPPEAPVTDLSGFQPNVEAISAFEPDLVVISGDPGDLTAGLEALGIEVLLQPVAGTLDDSYAQIRELGELTGRRDEAAAVVAGMRAGIDEIVSGAPAHLDGATYYYELDDTLFSVTSSTFMGSVLGLLGMTSIADAAEGAASGFPQLSAEFVLEADPDVVFLADTRCCNQDAGTVASRPGWSDLRAVRSGAVVELDDDVASRWGPRIVDLLRAAVERLAEAEVAPAA